MFGDVKISDGCEHLRAAAMLYKQKILPSEVQTLQFDLLSSGGDLP
jgi:hypothetical protein